MSIFTKDLEKFTLRKEQQVAFDIFKSAMEKNSAEKFFLFDLPTGVGKSLLAIMFADYYTTNVNKNAKVDMIIESKLLQQQYIDEFTSISNLWGRNGYQCNTFSCNCSDGAEFAKVTPAEQEEFCQNCPYEADKIKYLNGKLSLSNFHMYLTLHMYQAKMLEMRENNRLLIVDEAHSLEEVLSDFITINISEKVLKKMKIETNDLIDLVTKFQKIDVIDDFIDYCNNDLVPILVKTKKELEKGLGRGKNANIINRGLNGAILLETKAESLKVVKTIGEIDGLLSKIKNSVDDFNEEHTNWVLEMSRDNGGNQNFTLQTVWSNKYMDKVIWSKYDKIILMSGTILDKQMFCFLNGIPDSLCVYHSIPSPFKLKSRPIYYMPVGRMTHSTKYNVFQEYKPFIKKLLEKYKDKKGIIHTHTFEISQWIQKEIKSKRFIFHETDTKDFALKKHYTEDEPSILVSPSMTTGVNLFGDRARFQILAKIPYPSLASNKNKTRQKAMPDWYSYKTVSTIMQIYGRAVRSEDDNADMIVLDACFSDVMKYSSKFIPKYVSDAIVSVDMAKLKKSL